MRVTHVKTYNYIIPTLVKGKVAKSTTNLKSSEPVYSKNGIAEFPDAKSITFATTDEFRNNGNYVEQRTSVVSGKHFELGKRSHHQNDLSYMPSLWVENDFYNFSSRPVGLLDRFGVHYSLPCFNVHEYLSCNPVTSDFYENDMDYSSGILFRRRVILRNPDPNSITASILRDFYSDNVQRAKVSCSVYADMTGRTPSGMCGVHYDLVKFLNEKISGNVRYRCMSDLDRHIPSSRGSIPYTTAGNFTDCIVILTVDYFLDENTYMEHRGNYAFYMEEADMVIYLGEENSNNMSPDKRSIIPASKQGYVVAHPASIGHKIHNGAKSVAEHMNVKESLVQNNKFDIASYKKRKVMLSLKSLNTPTPKDLVLENDDFINIENQGFVYNIHSDDIENASRDLWFNCFGDVFKLPISRNQKFETGIYQLGTSGVFHYTLDEAIDKLPIATTRKEALLKTISPDKVHQLIMLESKEREMSKKLELEHLKFTQVQKTFEHERNMLEAKNTREVEQYERELKTEKLKHELDLKKLSLEKEKLLAEKQRLALDLKSKIEQVKVDKRKARTEMFKSIIALIVGLVTLTGTAIKLFAV